MDANKQKALDLALGQIEKAFGKEAICKLGGGGVKNVEAIPTGALSLDLALGVGGLPRGRVIEIYGPEAGGKTTLSLHVAAQTQKMGGTVAFIDAEHALDPVYAANLGVQYLTLEVRKSNLAAQSMYKSLGFIELGVRKRYYEDNGEDAYLMVCQNLPPVQEDFTDCE